MAQGFTDYLRPELGCMWGYPNGFGFALQAGASASATILWPAANKAFYYPIRMKSAALINRLNYIVATTAAGQNIDVGIYDSAGNLLVSAGSTAIGASTSLQTFTVTSTLIPKGLNYFGISSDSGATFRFLGLSTAIATLQGCGVQEQATAFPLPNPATFTPNVTTGAIPYFTIWSAALP